MTESPQRGVSRIALLRNTPTGTPGSGVFHLCITAILARRGHGERTRRTGEIRGDPHRGLADGERDKLGVGGQRRLLPAAEGPRARRRKRTLQRQGLPDPPSRAPISRGHCLEALRLRRVGPCEPTRLSLRPLLGGGRRPGPPDPRGSPVARAARAWARPGRSLLAALLPRPGSRAGARASRLPLLRTMRERLRSDFAQSGRAIFS